MYHYTSRHAAQGIHCTSVLRPRRKWLYLTTDVFNGGAEAADHLSIRFKPVEIRCEVEVDEAILQPPRKVRPIWDRQTGNVCELEQQSNT